jgi:hypothetical protein
VQPWETYTADTSIDLTKHHKPKTMFDKIAYWTVKSLRFPTDIFFQVRAMPSPPLPFYFFFRQHFAVQFLYD